MDDHIRQKTSKQIVFFDRAAKNAQKSTMGQKHGTVIVLDGEIIAEGHNRETTHMFHAFSVHAEVDALNKLNKTKFRHVFAKMEMFVVRIGPMSYNYALKYSKPCEDCQNAISRYGIKHVYYSINHESLPPSTIRGYEGRSPSAREAR